MTDRDDMLGRSIASRLDEGLASIDASALIRLREMRESALAKRRTASSVRAACAGVAAHLVAALRSLSPRHLVPVGILVVTLMVFGYWHDQVQKIDELADVDAGLLAGDLPIDAYLDKGLDSWLTRSPQ